MIISHENRFVFVKTTKTAGTSVEIGLTEFCGREDTITKLHPDDEAIKSEKGLRSAQNDIDVLASDGSRINLVNHASALRARRVLGTERWPEYFSFAFERNPFDRTVSAYHYIRKHRAANGTLDEKFTFANFIRDKKQLDRLHNFGWGLYTDNDIIIVDKVYKFEELSESMDEIHRQLGINNAPSLIRTKTSNRFSDYRDYYDPSDRKIVELHFNRELDAIGYSF